MTFDIKNHNHKKIEMAFHYLKGLPVNYYRHLISLSGGL